MSDILWQGLIISGLGLGLLFAAMILLMLLMMLIERLFRDAGRPAVAKEKSTVSKMTPQSQEQEIAAAIAVALAHFRSLDICRANLGATLETERGRWWQSGQSRPAPIPKPARRNSK